MTIAVDISQINRDQAGVNNYLRGLLTGLAKQREQAELKDLKIILVSRRVEDFAAEWNGSFESLVLPDLPKWLGGGLAWYFQLGRVLRKQQVNILVCATMNVAPLFFPTAMIVHDLSPLTHPHTFEPGLVWRFRLSAWVVNLFAEKILCVTETTKSIWLAFFKRRPAAEIGVTQEGLNDWTHVAKDVERELQVKRKYNLPDRFLLSLGTLQPRKNYVFAIRAFARARLQNDQLHYVIAGGRGWLYDDILKEIKKWQLSEYVHLTGFIDKEDIAYLFDAATAFVQLSLDEGFGLPLIEARARGLPILCSDIPVFRELKFDTPPVWVSPISEQAAADGMLAVAREGRHTPESAFLETYSWPQVAKNLLQFITN
jgi:glycosyltransferase involved in cell wall biosynthesis